MQRLGLPNETLEHDVIFGDVLVSVDMDCAYPVDIVTLIWETPFNSGDKKPLATVMSIEYDAVIMNRVHKVKWLYELLAQPRALKGHFLRGETDEFLVAQSLAYDQINKIRELQSHDRPTDGTTALASGHGLEGEAVHCVA